MRNSRTSCTARGSRTKSAPSCSASSRASDLARELAEQLGADFVLLPLAVHDVLELGMTGHDRLRSRRVKGRVLARGYIGRAATKINYSQNLGRASSSTPPSRTGPTL